MKITWFGHACFSLQEDNYTIVIDPFRDVPGYENINMEANAVYSSHGHFDHCYFDEINLISNKNNPFTVEKIECFHDNVNGEKRGKKLIHVFSANKLTVVHLGDLGHVLNEEQVKKLKHCHVLLVPVGGYYTIDAAAAKTVCEQIKPEIIIPMHYRKNGKGLPAVTELTPFLEINKDYPVVFSSSNFLNIDSSLPSQITVLDWKG